MKKLLFGVVILFFLIIPHRMTQAAVSPPTPVPPPFMGQTQYYSVTFRGNGEAVVLGRFQIPNAADSPLSSVSFRIPNIRISDLQAYQVTGQPRCIQYQSMPMTDMISVKPGNPNATNCISYDDGGNWDSGGLMGYEKATADLTGDTITVTLPKSVEKNKTAGLLLSYRAFGYTKKQAFGAYSYTFETLKVTGSIQTLSVGISVDQELHLSGAKGKTNFRFAESASSLASPKMMDMANTQAASQFRSFFYQIGSGDIVKTATNLQSMESFTVKGRYASNLIGLYWGGYLAGAVVLILIIVGLFFLLKKLGKPQTNVSKATSDHTRQWLSLGSVSFLSSLCIIGFTILLVIVKQNDFISTIGGDFDIEGLLNVLLTIIAIAAYLVLFAGPAFLVGTKYGKLWGLATFAGTLLFLIFYVILAVVLVGPTQRRYYSIPMTQTMESTVEAISKTP